jgi:hypothetical protein
VIPVQAITSFDVNCCCILVMSCFKQTSAQMFETF